MSRRYIQSICMLLLLLATASHSIPVRGALHDKYSQEHPLVIVCDWDLPPYEFLDDNGNPAGFIIDVLSKILDRQKLPYTFVMKENQQIKSIFSQGEADLLVAPSFLFNDDNCHMSSNVMCYYKTKAAMREGDPSINSMRDIPADKVVVLRKDGQIVAQGLQDINKDRELEFRGPMEALQGVLNKKFDLFIWGEEPLKWKIKELNLEGLRISDIDVPIIELHIGSHDKELVDAVDDQFARLDQNGELDTLRDKWFHPERHHDNASPVYLYVAIAVILLLLLLFLLNRLVSRNLKHIMQRNSEQTRVMNLALDLGGYMVSEYNPKKDAFKNLRGHLMDETKNLTQSFDTLHADDRQVFQEKVAELKHGETNTPAVLLRCNEGTAFRPKWQYLTGNCIKERDEDDHINYLLVAKNITRETEEEQAIRELAAKYLKAFDISLVAMAFYDKDGVLLEMNERMKSVVGTDDKNQEFFYNTLLFEAPLFRGVLHPGMRDRKSVV